MAVVRFDGIVGILKWGEVATGSVDGSKRISWSGVSWNTSILLNGDRRCLALQIVTSLLKSGVQNSWCGDSHRVAVD